MKPFFKAILGIWIASLATLAHASGDDIYWHVTANGAEEHGIHVLDGADGILKWTQEGENHCVANNPTANPPSPYLYITVDDHWLGENSKPVYLILDYFDTQVGVAIHVEYDATGDPATGASYHLQDDQWGRGLTGSRKWQKTVILLEHPTFQNRQNLGADFRISGGNIYIRSITLTHTQPSLCKKLEQTELRKLHSKIHIGHGGQLIIGGFDPTSVENGRDQVRALKMAAPAMRSLGVTSHEGYVRWNLCEPEEGKYDWRVYDAFVDVYKKYGLKWVPFLIIGSPYSLPDWYYKKPASQGYVCLEHGQESDVQSLWNPTLRSHVIHFIQAFCEHYRDQDIIESILLGVTGNYGEAIYPASGNDWTSSVHGEYHTHAGFWAGDPFAIANFQQCLKTKYQTPDALNTAWGGTTFTTFETIKPFLRKDAPNDRSWLDFCDWYINSMTEWSRLWLTTTRQYFPKGDIYLCTGGHAPAEHGSNFGEQCKVAASVGAGVRITNEASDYRLNFSLTRWVASAGQQYGAYYSFEPAGEVTPDGVVARIHNATTAGARGLHYYYPNIFGNEQATTNFTRWANTFKQRKPHIEVAVYYPETYIKLKGNNFLKYVYPLRDDFDFTYMSDEQIMDDGLKHIHALILLWGNVLEKPILTRITDWVQQGGLVFYPTGLGTLQTVEGDPSLHEALFAPGAHLGKGRIQRFEGDPASQEYRRFLTHELATAPELSKAAKKTIAADGREDNVFVSLLNNHKRLWLNFNSQPVHQKGFTIQPLSITEH